MLLAALATVIAVAVVKFRLKLIPLFRFIAPPVTATYPPLFLEYALFTRFVSAAGATLHIGALLLKVTCPVLKVLSPLNVLAPLLVIAPLNVVAPLRVLLPATVWLPVRLTVALALALAFTLVSTSVLV